jgi:hypothetical protein
VYIAEGHAAFLESTKDNFQSRPWQDLEGMRAAELCYVTSLEYRIDDSGAMHSIVQLTLKVT